MEQAEASLGFDPSINERRNGSLQLGMAARGIVAALSAPSGTRAAVNLYSFLLLPMRARFKRCDLDQLC